MKNVIRLTESNLHRIVKESIKKALREEKVKPKNIKKWNQIERVVGSTEMISELFNYLDADTIADFINAMEDTYDLEQKDEGRDMNLMDFRCGQTCG